MLCEGRECVFSTAGISVRSVDLVCPVWFHLISIVGLLAKTNISERNWRQYWHFSTNYGVNNDTSHVSFMSLELQYVTFPTPTAEKSKNDSFSCFTLLCATVSLLRCQ